VEKQKKLTIYGIYSPPKNQNLSLNNLEISPRTIVVGDFNAASPSWGYNYISEAGKVVEDLLNTNNTELLYNSTDIPTFLHYTGATTNPDLAVITSNLVHQTSREVIEDPGCGH
jgi:hypothetical protein